jgi:hypothetical protein
MAGLPLTNTCSTTGTGELIADITTTLYGNRAKHTDINMIVSV